MANEGRKMSNSKEVNNDFLLKLLSLQQDGGQAISAPSNWTRQQPLLEVPTDIDHIIDGLAETLLLKGRSEPYASWHFFIGSPGNGKSAAVGRLSRLLREKDCIILDENDTSIEEIGAESIPYSLRVFEKDNLYASAMIVQDASVVRKPFAKDVDPATELCSILEETWDKGVSLVVCTNRGVIEKAYRERYLVKEYNTKLWFKLLRQLIENGEHVLEGQIGDKWRFDGGRPVFPEVEVRYSYLDNKSIVLGSSVLESILMKATVDSEWAVCADCDVRNICPFKLNRDWLRDSDARSHFLKIVCRSEVLSGQIIVFREALALVSLILAGCPKDYDQNHPCQWVREKAKSHGVFALAMRRIYMSVFSSFCPYGLEPNRREYSQQIDALKTLSESAKGRNVDAREKLLNVLTEKPPSSDVGTVRLTGPKGIFAELDPWLDTMPAPFLDCWDSELAVMAQCKHPQFTDIERHCIKTWTILEELIETTLSHESSLYYWSLRRWSSNFLIHFGALLEGLTIWNAELDEFIAVLEILHKRPEDRSVTEKQLIRSIDRQLEDLLAARAGDQNDKNLVQLSESVVLEGRWVADKLRPRIQAAETSTSLALSIKFHDEETAAVSSRAFTWLRRHLGKGLYAQCFPGELLTGIVDARVRAASKGKSNYARDNDDVELKVITGGKTNYVFTRFDGDVHVDTVES